MAKMPLKKFLKGPYWPNQEPLYEDSFIIVPKNQDPLKAFSKGILVDQVEYLSKKTCV